MQINHLKIIGILLLMIFISGYLDSRKIYFNKPADEKATKETVRLYNKLKRASKRGIMIGLAYGVHWRYREERCNVKEITGDYPAVYGWDVGNIESGDAFNIDSISFYSMKKHITEAYSRGSVITISWLGKNPLTGGNSFDTDPATVASILPEGDKHELFKIKLDKVAKFLGSLKGKRGEPIPLLFRPYHKLTEDHFWWGSMACSPEEYRRLYRFTVEYLKDVKKLNNILYVYSTGADFKSETNYLERYPGDDVIDILSFDAYHEDSPEAKQHFIETVDSALSVISKVAAARNKLIAFAETGFNGIPDPKWWTQTLLKTIEKYELSYVLLWRNTAINPQQQHAEYYIPYKGHASEEDFIEFYSNSKTIFGKEAEKLKLYR